MNYNQSNQSQSGSRNYLAYDMSSNPFDKYEGYVMTNFDQSDKKLFEPSNMLEETPSFSQQQLIHNQRAQHVQQQTYQQPVNQSEQKLHNTNNYFQCPTCLELAISSCDCEYRDCSCPNGHKWYRVSGVKTMGISPNHRKA